MSKKALTLDVGPVEFYEGGDLKKFIDVKQDLSGEKVGKELSTGVYLEVIGGLPENSAMLDCFNKCKGGYCSC